MHDQNSLNTMLDQIAAQDADLKQALREIGYPQPRSRPMGFETMLRTLVGQQLSVSAAAAIFNRLIAGFDDQVPSPQQIMDSQDQDLRALGLSGQKVGYIKSLSRAILEDQLNFERLSVLEDEEAIAMITAIRGFGRWSAEIYLMFAHQRADLWPADDLALQVGLMRLKGLDERPKKRKVSEPLIENWRPYRSAGALFLWHLYGSATLDDAKPKKA